MQHVPHPNDWTDEYAEIECELCDDGEYRSGRECLTCGGRGRRVARLTIAESEFLRGIGEGSDRVRR